MIQDITVISSGLCNDGSVRRLLYDAAYVGDVCDDLFLYYRK